jgi:hypothetical protein
LQHLELLPQQAPRIQGVSLRFKTPQILRFLGDLKFGRFNLVLVVRLARSASTGYGCSPRLTLIVPPDACFGDGTFDGCCVATEAMMSGMYCEVREQHEDEMSQG